MADQLLEADQAFRQLLGNAGLNREATWVVAGSKSTTESQFLPMIRICFFCSGSLVRATPSWSRSDVSGATIAGVPFVVIGRNQFIAWGVTNAMLDDEDFYVEEVDSIQHPSRYRFNGDWRPMYQQVDTIFVKNSPPVFLTTYRTHRGPIVNRMEPSAQFATVAVDAMDRP